MLLFDSDAAAQAFSPSAPVFIRDLLVDLGFEAIMDEYTDQQPGYQFNFGDLVLRACQLTNLYLRPAFCFSGIISTTRTCEMVEFWLPLEMESYEQGVALISYNIGQSFTPLRPTPWLEQGRLWEEHLPGRRELRLHAQRPQCHVEAEWFRVAVKKLLEHGLKADDTQVFKVSFMAGVLKFDLFNQILVMPAQGKDWPETYYCLSTGLASLSKRTPSDGVSLGIWKDKLAIGGLQLSIRPEFLAE